MKAIEGLHYMSNISMWMWPCRTNFISVQMRGAQVLNFPHEHSNTQTHTHTLWMHVGSSELFQKVRELAQDHPAQNDHS
jgi:hypothetical protein